MATGLIGESITDCVAGAEAGISGTGVDVLRDRPEGMSTVGRRSPGNVKLRSLVFLFSLPPSFELRRKAPNVALSMIWGDIDRCGPVCPNRKSIVPRITGMWEQLEFYRLQLV